MFIKSYSGYYMLISVTDIVRKAYHGSEQTALILSGTSEGGGIIGFTLCGD